MKPAFLLFFLFFSLSNIFSQDSLGVSADSLHHNKIKDLQLRFCIHPFQGQPEVYLVKSLRSIGVFLFADFSHKKIFKPDSTYSNLPIAITDSTVFYEVRSYSNQKYAVGLGLEWKINPNAKDTYFVLGLKFSAGKYMVQDYWATIYYQYYRDSNNQVYYYDKYGLPSWDRDDAFTNILSYAKANLEFRSVNIEPYIGFQGLPQKNGVSGGIYFGMKYENFRAFETDVFDYQGRLNNPVTDFNRIRLTIKMSLIFSLSRNA